VILSTVCLILGLITIGGLLSIPGPTIVMLLAGFLGLVIWYIWKSVVKKSFPPLSEEAAKKRQKKQGADEHREGFAKEVAKDAFADGVQDAVVEGIKNLLH
jgi:hypothetical protein